MGNHTDPYDNLERPTLAEQVAPYQGYGDAELAVSLLAFHRKFAVGIGALGAPADRLTFDVQCRPADTGADYVCTNCDEPVRGVTRPDGDVLACPLCGEMPGMLTLGRGVSDDGQ